MTDEAAFLSYVAEIDAIPDPNERAAALHAWARSEAWHPSLMLADEPLGPTALEAFQIHRAALDRDTPGRAWEKADYRYGRASILRALKIDPNDPYAFYATLPFRIIEVDGTNFIAGAVGCPRVLDFGAEPAWCHLDIADVVLWNPRTGYLRVLGEAPEQTLVIRPDRHEETLAVYATGFEFFRDWADRRAQHYAKWQAAQANPGLITPREPADSNIPGVLVIGSLGKVQWLSLEAPILDAAPGVDPAALKKAVFRSARLPRVTSLRSAA